MKAFCPEVHKAWPPSLILTLKTIRGSKHTSTLRVGVRVKVRNGRGGETK